MARPTFSGSQLPEYHAGMLVVKVRASSNLRSTFTATATAASANVLETQGLSALSTFERAGLIKRITPIARSNQAQIPSITTGSMMATLATSIEGIAPENISSGVNIIELEHDRHVSELQLALANDPNIEYVSRVAVRYLFAQPKSSNSGATIAAAAQPASSLMWNLDKIQWKAAFELTNVENADNIRVAVLDTGIDVNHPDLQGRVKSYVYEHPDLPITSSDRDIIGHGTHVSGTITAAIDNGLGINGICNCELNVWKIFDDRPDFVSCSRGYVYYVDPVMYRRALLDCLEQNIDVINLSIGGRRFDPSERDLFNNLIANGTTVIAAMGNEREEGSPTSYPAAYPGVIAVGASSRDDTIASFSNSGNHITIAAPGVAIWSTLPTYTGNSRFTADCTGANPSLGRAIQRETNYDAWNGTSMATPHVTGAVALLIANRGERLSPADIKNQLIQTADKVPAMGGNDFTADFGAGRLNLVRLLSE
jgi:subtilisin family serine protease